MTYLEKVYETVNDMIEDIKAVTACDYIPYYWENDKREVNLCEYFEDYFACSNFIHEYSIEETSCFENPAYECGVLSIAFTTIEGELGHIVIEWEER